MRAKPALPALLQAESQSVGFLDPCALADYTLGPVIGTGSFGRVTLASHRSTRTVCAIKALSKAHLLKHQQVCPYAYRCLHHELFAQHEARTTALALSSTCRAVGPGIAPTLRARHPATGRPPGHRAVAGQLSGLLLLHMHHYRAPDKDTNVLLALLLGMECSRCTLCPACADRQESALDVWMTSHCGFRSRLPAPSTLGGLLSKQAMKRVDQFCLQQADKRGRVVLALPWTLLS